MNDKIKTDFKELSLNKIIPKPAIKVVKKVLKEDLIDGILQDIIEINIYEYMESLGWKAKNKEGEVSRPPEKKLKVGLIEYLLEFAKGKEWKIIKDESNTIYIYNGAYWIPFNKNEIISFLMKFNLKIGIPLLEAKEEVFIEKLYKQLITILPIREKKRNVLNLINLQNGTFNIETMELQKFNPDDFLTYQLNFSYNPYATNELWNKFLDEVIPNKDTQRTLQEVLGSIFIKDIKFEYAYFFYGSGANGKSVIMEVLKELLGKNNISSFSIDNLNKESNRAELKDKILNIASEAETKEIKSDLFKQLSSGEPVMARKLFGDPFQMEDYAKFVFLVNRLELKNIEYTEGFFRRFLIIPFNVTIPKEKRDKKLHLKIINEGLNGVLNWIIEGAKRVLENENIFISIECKTAFENFIKDIDSVSQFLDDKNLVKSSTERYYTNKLMIDYKQWCIDNNLRPLGRNKLFERLKALGFTRAKDTNYYFSIGQKR
jgi:putative DNA primase/helicase